MPENRKHQFISILDAGVLCIVSFIDGNSKNGKENFLQIQYSNSNSRYVRYFLISDKTV